MPKYIAVVGITNDEMKIRVERGEVVPDKLVKAASWLVDEALVVPEADFMAQEQKPTAQDPAEGAQDVGPDGGDLGDAIAAPVAAEEVES